MNPTTHTNNTAVLETGACANTDLRTILLLDPVTLCLRLEETILSRRDWRIHPVRTAEAAMAILEREHVDLVVMDHVLPDASGDAFIRGLRANPRTRATAVLVLTARGSQASVDRCLEAGANGVLFKPVTRQDLCMRAEDLLYVAARRHVRTLVRLKVDATTGSGVLFATTINVSAGGLLLECEAPMTQGEEMELRFALPGESDPVVARARVVRELEGAAPGRFAIGLAFEGMSDADRVRIEGFVAAMKNDQGAFASAR